MPVQPHVQAYIHSVIDKRMVLVIEPQPNYRQSIRGFLHNLKITHIKIVPGVAEAQVAMLTEKIGLVIVEWDLRGKNGLQFVRDLKQDPDYQNVPCLLLTIENQRHDVILAGEIGIDGYLLKPFSFEDFAQAMINVCKSVGKPNPLNSKLALAERSLQEGEYKVARDLFDECVLLNPDSARAICGLGRLSALQGDFEASKAYYRKAIKSNPDYIDGYRDFLEVLDHCGPATELIEVCETVIGISPANPKYTLLLAKAYLDTSNFVDSEKYFKATIRHAPKLAEAFKGLGQVYFAKEEFEDAMKNFNKAIDLDPKDISTLNSLGLTYVKLGRITSGISKYQMALRYAPDDPRVLFNLAFAYEKSDLHNKAIETYERVLDIEPNQQKALRRLAEVRQKLSGKRTG